MRLVTDYLIEKPRSEISLRGFGEDFLFKYTILVNMFVIDAVSAKGQLVVPVIQIFAEIYARGQSGFNLPAIPGFIFTEHPAFYFLAAEKFMAFDRHYLPPPFR